MEHEWWLLWIFSLCVAAMGGFFLFKDRAQKATRAAAAAARESLADELIDNEPLPPIEPHSPTVHKSSMVWSGDQQLPANEVYRPTAEWSPTSPSPSSTAITPTTGSSSSSTDVAHAHRRARLVIVAKHLPINVIANGDDWRVEWDDARSFLSNLRSLQETGMDVTWVGMPPPGIDISTAALQNKLSAALATHHCVPVFIEPTLCDTFIKGFCKTVLWPLFHYVIPRARHGFAQNWDTRWDAYQKANELFAIAVATALGGDGSNHGPVSVWVQNYQLLLVPSYLRTRLPRARIGLFLHTPFPSSDLLRLLPAREALLRGIMCADLLGFYTYDYARHFLSCLKRVLNLDWETLSGGSLGIKYAGRQVSIRISHVGIDSQAFADAAKSPAVMARAAEIRAKFHPRRIIIGMDDLDEVKGSVLKLQAYDRFLTNHSEWRDKVVLYQVILPTRHTFIKPPEMIIPLSTCNETKTATDAKTPSSPAVSPAAAASPVAAVLTPDPSPTSAMAAFLNDEEEENGSDSRQGWFMKTIEEIRTNHGADSIHVVDSSVSGNDLSFTETVALYAAASVAVVSTFWDGLNVIPYQFSVSTPMEDPGALVVSEFMGCSRSLSGTIRVNPWAVESVGDAMHQALSMSLEERKANHLRRYNYVMSQSLKAWAQGFVEHLGTAAHTSDNLVFAQVGTTTGGGMRWVGLRADFHPLDMSLLTSCYTATKAPRGSSHPTRVFLLDYDGTLTSIEKDPEKNKMKGPSPSLKRSLRTLCSDPSNCVFIIAGRQRSALLTWFGDIPELGLAAEKGTFIRWPQSRNELFRATGPARVSTPSLAPLPAPPSPLIVAKPLMAPAFPPLSLGHSATNTTRQQEHTESSAYRERKDSMDNERMVNVQWETMVPDLEVRWKHTALAILKEYTSHTDGSWIEDKEFAIVWHYARADPEYGRMQATELQKYLIRIFPADEVDVIKYDYNHILELKPHGINKGNTAAFILRTVLAPPPPPPPPVAVTRSRSLSFSRTEPPPPVVAPVPPQQPLLVCIGDDRSDEDMFRAVHRRDDLLKPSIGPTGLSISSPGTTNNTGSHHMGIVGHGHGHTRDGSRGGSGTTTPVGGHSRRASQALPSADDHLPANSNTFSICVGIKPSIARFYVHDSDEVGRVLASLAATGSRAPMQ